MLREAADEYTSPQHPRGCMVMSEPRLAAQRAESHRLAARLQLGVDAGDLPVDTDVEALTGYVSAVMTGMSASARDGATADELGGVAELAMAAWPAPAASRQCARQALSARRHSTRRRPLGAIDGSACGQLDHELGAVGREDVLATAAPARPAVSVVSRSQRSTGDPAGTSSSAASSAVAASAPMVCVAPRSATSEQLVERRALDVRPGQVLAELGRAPHGDDGERLAVGEVEPLDPQHLIASRAPRRRAARCGGERELDDLALGMDAAVDQLALDRAELGERSAAAVRAADEPAEALPGGDQPLVAQRLERAADRDPAGVELVADSSASLGSTRPAPYCPSATRSRSASAISWYRIVRIELVL